MRNLQKITCFGRYIVGEPSHFTRKNSKASGLVLLADIKKHLETNANAQDGYSSAEEFPKQLIKPKLPQAFHGFPGGPDPGEDHLIRLTDFIMGVGDPAWKSKIIQCPLHAGQVPRFVVEYGNHASALLLLIL
jgi:hypothetical protein